MLIATAESRATTQPQTLLWLSACYALFMWTFSTLVASMTLYLTTLPHIQTSQAYTYYAIFASLLWILPVVGGALSEKCGYFQSAIVGLLLCLSSLLFVCHPNLTSVFIGLSLFLIGNSFFTPAVWCLVDHLYHKTDSRREAGFTLFYLLFNVGAVGGIFISSYIRIRFNYAIEFSSCAFILGLALAALLYSRSQYSVAEGRSIAPQVNLSSAAIYNSLALGSLIATPCVFILFNHPNINTALVYSAAIMSLGYLIQLAHKQPSKKQCQQVYGFIVLCIFVLGFWTLYNLEPSLVSVFIEKNVNKTLLGFHFSADAFFGFEATFIVIVGLLLTRLWSYLGRKNKDISLAIKFGLALLIIGAGFIYLNMIIQLNGMNQRLPASLIILSYLFFATGELFIGPLGISMVGKLAPLGKEGSLMGVWQLILGVGAIVSGWLAKQSVVPKHASFQQSQSRYAHLFNEFGLVIIFCGLLVLAVSPWVKKLLNDR